MGKEDKETGKKKPRQKYPNFRAKKPRQECPNFWAKFIIWLIISCGLLTTGTMLLIHWFLTHPQPWETFCPW
jgi:hypothetical protein